MDSADSQVARPECEELALRWSTVPADGGGGAPPALDDLLRDCAGATGRVVELVTLDAQNRWERGLPAGIDHYAGVLADLLSNKRICRAVLMQELMWREDRRAGDVAESLKRRHPALAGEIDTVVGLYRLVGDEVEEKADQGRPPARLEKYELVALLGRGAFGEVWQAWDTELERYVALKLIRMSEGVRRQRSARAMLAEAQAAAGIDHENVVRVHAAGRFDEHGLIYIDSQLVGDAAPGLSKEVVVGGALDRCSAMTANQAGTSANPPAMNFDPRPRTQRVASQTVAKVHHKRPRPSTARATDGSSNANCQTNPASATTPSA